MKLPVQAVPVKRPVCTAGKSGRREGVNPSDMLDFANKNLQCQLCCGMSKNRSIDCSAVIPGCLC
jgi:hypothetical protein